MAKNFDYQNSKLTCTLSAQIISNQNSKLCCVISVKILTKYAFNYICIPLVKSLKYIILNRRIKSEKQINEYNKNCKVTYRSFPIFYLLARSKYSPRHGSEVRVVGVLYQIIIMIGTLHMSVKWIIVSQVDLMQKNNVVKSHLAKHYWFRRVLCIHEKHAVAFLGVEAGQP